MKIYLWSLLLSLSLGAIEIPLYGSASGYGDSHFYLDISSLEVGETINLQVVFIYSHYSYDFQLEYKNSNSYSESDFLYGFQTLDPESYTYEYYDYFNYNYTYYFSLTKNSRMYSFLLLKTNLNIYNRVTIYHIKNKDYSWVIWLVIGIIIIICITIFVILYLKRKKEAKALPGSSHQPAANDNQPPVNAYQPPVYEPQPPQYVQSS